MKNKACIACGAIRVRRSEYCSECRPIALRAAAVIRMRRRNKRSIASLREARVLDVYVEVAVQEGALSELISFSDGPHISLGTGGFDVYSFSSVAQLEAACRELKVQVPAYKRVTLSGALLKPFVYSTVIETVLRARGLVREL